MATASLSSTALFFVATNEGSYPAAREGSGVSKYISQYGWVGQYFGGNYEVNQVFAGFDLSALPANAVITAAKLTLTLAESFGTTVVEVRQHDFTPNNISAFVPGSQLANKPLLGGANINDGFIGTVAVDLTGLTRDGLAKFVLASTTQRTGTAPSGDTTTRVTAAKLDITYSLVTVITTTGSGSWTVPAGVNSIKVEAWGAGGGGDVQNDAGGGGGAYSASTLTVTPGQTFSYTVGAGGLGLKVTPYRPSTMGGDTWFGSTSTVLAKGGDYRAGSTGLGGQAGSGFGSTKYSGGNGVRWAGGAGSFGPGAGGGGAGHPLGNGGNAGAGTSQSPGVSGASGSRSGVVNAAGISNIEGGSGGFGRNNAGGAPGGGGGSDSTSNDGGGDGGRGQIRITYDTASAPPAPARRAPRSFYWL